MNKEDVLTTVDRCCTNKKSRVEKIAKISSKM